jgi:hypothetical protein
VTARWPIPRPTENTAIGNACRTARPLPSMPALFLALLDAYALRDRHGLNLAGHHIARAGNGDMCPLCEFFRCRCND